MYGCKVDCEHAPRKASKGPFCSFRFIHEPHEHVVLRLRINGKISIQESRWADRFVIPIVPKFLHSRKTLLDHRSDEFHFLSDFRWKVR